ncbi:MAG: PaaI family thioesterase [Hyphomicrobiales bacterium]|nr:PaaI family thioesterase [Hyphomicrobiales bacterium]
MDREAFRRDAGGEVAGRSPPRLRSRQRRGDHRLTAHTDFCNLLGWIQGGMLTAMLDIAMSYAALCMFEEEHLVPSLEIKTTYVAPARPGQLVATGSVLRMGSTIVFMEGRMVDADGKLLATASATGQLRRR